MMILLSKLCGVVIFVYCVCRLSGRVYGYRNLSLWAHLCLIPSAVAMMITQTPPSMESAVFKVGVALYFASQTWKIWRLQKRFKNMQKVEPIASPFSAPKPHIKLKHSSK